MDIQCELCPKGCIMAPGQSGDCRIRVNMDGKLRAVTYGHACAAHVDPIEKKPLFHFLPGSTIFSIATVGCNLHCKNCQNWEISQQDPEKVPADSLPPDDIPRLAKSCGCPSVAYTYTEPLVYYEYTLDASRSARAAGLRNILVSAGYINRPPMERLCEYTDGATIDLKGITDALYRDVCQGTLKPVLNTLVLTKSLGVHLEVSNLLIPTLNDTDKDIRDLCRWLAANLGKETPLHFLRFFPQYKMKGLPPTPGETLQRARNIARSEGLYYVYAGNILLPEGQNTYCPRCNTLLIERRGMAILSNALEAGKCPQCNSEIYGVWS